MSVALSTTAANGIRCINLADILRALWELKILTQTDVKQIITEIETKIDSNELNLFFQAMSEIARLSTTVSSDHGVFFIILTLPYQILGGDDIFYRSDTACLFS